MRVTLFFFIFFWLNDVVHTVQYFLFCLLIFDFRIDFQCRVYIGMAYPLLNPFHTGAFRYGMVDRKLLFLKADTGPA